MPDKNILPIGGIPLLVRAYRVACSLPLDVRVVVSTDSFRYLELLSEEGYADPALRPADLSTSGALVIDAILYELARVGALDDDLIVLIEPSFVGRRSTNLRQAIELVCCKEVDSCFGVYPVPAAFHHAKQFVRDGEQVQCVGPANINRQQLPQAYVRSGEFYLSRVALVRSERSLLGGRLAMFETAQPFVNIDHAADVERAVQIPNDAQD